MSPPWPLHPTTSSTDDERDRIAARDPHNSVQLILPVDSDRGDGYATAAALLDAWRADGTLATDEAPAFYGYRMTFTDPHGVRRVTHGILGALGLPPDGPGTGDILPHERTIPKHRSDRLNLLEATRTNLDPIWGLTPAAGFGRLAGEPGADRQRALDDTGVEHEAWAITDPDRIVAIADAVASAPLVLADGHHRFETACAYRAAHGDARGDDAIMTLVVELAEDELWVAPIHRLVKGAPHLRTRLEPAFAITPLGPATPAAVGRARGPDGRGRRARAGRRRGDRAAARPVRGRQPTRSRRSRPRFATSMPRSSRPLCSPASTAPSSSSATTHRVLADSVARGEADAVVLLRPVSVAQIRHASVRGGAHAPEDDVLRAQAAHRASCSAALDD